MDDRAASPLTVILTVALVTAAVVAVVVYATTGRDEPAWDVDPDPAGRAFVVQEAPGDVRWSEVEVQLLDSAGFDRAGLFLTIPDGVVKRGQELPVRQGVPASTYLLRILVDGDVQATATLRL